jgi:hypothetical protein
MVAPLRLAFCALIPAIAAVSLVEQGFAAKRGSTRNAVKPAASRTIELFDGIKSGDLSVRVIPKNEFLSRVRVTNTTRQPLTVKLPQTVAAVQVFKQAFGPAPLFPGNQNNGNPFGNGNNAGSNRHGQAVGGQFGNGPGNGVGNGVGNQNFNGFGNIPNPGAGNGFGNGFFSVPAEKTVIVPLHTVCLEHGKPTPNVRMAYELRPLRKVVDDPALERLLRAFHPKKTDRRVLQAAAWNLASRMSWRQLRAKSFRHIGQSPRPYFSSRELRAAYRIVDAAKKDAKPAESRSVRVRLTRR